MRAAAVSDRVIHHLINLCERMRAHHPTKKARQLATARFETACQITAYVTGVDNWTVVWLSVSAALDTSGRQLHGAASGTVARDQRLAHLIHAIAVT
ncbi:MULTISPECIES: hypothetical protein [unclassified Nocardia]|uniref:hypothetical protein n=1 Tax=unclassified Nocardia TaxID=2637762 RepID=UPI001CE46822|nr:MULTISPECIES: hypothetical protein [unclassified Nocardia]